MIARSIYNVIKQLLTQPEGKIVYTIKAVVQNKECYCGVNDNNIIVHGVHIHTIMSYNNIIIIRLSEIIIFRLPKYYII